MEGTADLPAAQVWNRARFCDTPWGVKGTAWAADERTIRHWDGALVVWVTAWIIAGAVLGYEIWQMTGLAQTTISSGRQLGQAGEKLQSLSGAPIVGGTVADVGAQISATGADLVKGGRSADQSVRAISVLVGLSVAVVPSAAAMAVYLPIRRNRRRDQEDIRGFLEREGLTPALEAVLARRAVATLPVPVVFSLSDHPHQDLADGRHHSLAVAELARMGITVSKPEPG